MAESSSDWLIAYIELQEDGLVDERFDITPQGNDTAVKMWLSHTIKEKILMSQWAIKQASGV